VEWQVLLAWLMLLHWCLMSCCRFC
jgi:hypothetical protein